MGLMASAWLVHQGQEMRQEAAANLRGAAQTRLDRGVHQVGSPCKKWVCRSTSAPYVLRLARRSRH